MGRLSRKNEGLLTFADYRKKTARAVYGALLVFMLLAMLVVGVPILWVLVSGLKSAEEVTGAAFFPTVWQFAAVPKVWRTLNFGRHLLNSATVVAGAVLCSVFFNALLAYSAAVVRPKGSRLVSAMVFATMMVPPTTNLLALYKLIVDTGLNGSFLPVCLSYGASAYYFVLFKAYFSSLSQSVVEAAKIDGCGRFGIFWKIILPLSLPIILVVAMFTVNASWSDFLFPYLVLFGKKDRYTVMVKIYDMVSAPDVLKKNELILALSFSILPPVVFFAFLADKITSTVSTSGMKD